MSGFWLQLMLGSNDGEMGRVLGRILNEARVGGRGLHISAI